MRLLALALVLTSSAGVAQSPPGVSPTGFGRLINPSGVPLTGPGAGFGRVIYPGTGGPPGVQRPGFGFGQGFGGGFGPGQGFGGGFGPGQGFGGGFGPGSKNFAFTGVRHPFHNNTIIVPYPVFYGGGSYGYGYDAPPAPVEGSEAQLGYSAQQPSPVVVLNQKFGPDVNAPPGGYAPPPPPSPDQGQAAAAGSEDTQFLFLIAMKDHTIFPAVAFWVEGNTLNYITNQGVRNQISLDLVDRDFSKQLNQQRGVDFALPDTK